MFSIERLRALAAVAQYGSIAKAAQARHVTPSGMSQQLAKLEREAGRRLLEPDGRTVRLTLAGRVLAGHADQVLAQLARARRDLDDLGEEVMGPLRIGGVGSAVRSLLAGALSRLLAAHPRVEPSVRDGEAVDLLPWLMRDELDLVLIESWTSRPIPLPAGVSAVDLVDEEVCVALPEGHPLSGRDRVGLEELAEEAWASCPPGTEPCEALIQAARAAGFEPRISFSLTELPTQLALVEAGLTAALVPEMGRTPGPPGVRFVPLRSPLRRTVRAAWRAAAETPPVTACVDALRAVPAG
ncbi:LysR family transcriptional regulator [Nocardiopsis composta]|uniref:DNA-binding transcriptional LysR family regulator n=1 Tax=Nocardiopsis composta TaxID=157465 RepID=A0A7W8QPY6_9ACTN|nr:LysR family transcriptional regulator [Nocardiopsis composta]MBB5433758.1 DNA-binding transcriptional LysR family regulator [Nocardiopsis composta]